MKLDLSILDACLMATTVGAGPVEGDAFVDTVRAWPYSSFHRYCEQGLLSPD
jgi:hypothetical protein